MSKAVTKTIYECETCGAEFGFGEDAYDCEQSHDKQFKITRTTSFSLSGSLRGWPEEVLVENEEGTRYAYVLKPR
jgi:DNA-directed RNA polymerase subunit RPC12/RpoP